MVLAYRRENRERPASCLAAMAEGGSLAVSHTCLAVSKPTAPATRQDHPSHGDRKLTTNRASRKPAGIPIWGQAAM